MIGEMSSLSSPIKILGSQPMCQVNRGCEALSCHLLSMDITCQAGEHLPSMDK